jgi:hypothetical protein
MWTIILSLFCYHFYSTYLKVKPCLLHCFFVMPLAVCMPVVHGCWPKLCMRFVVQMAVLIALVCVYWSQCLTGASHLHVLGSPISVGLFVLSTLLVSDIIVACHIAVNLCNLNLILCLKLHIMYFLFIFNYYIFIYLLTVHS